MRTLPNTWPFRRDTVSVISHWPFPITILPIRLRAAQQASHPAPTALKDSGIYHLPAITDCSLTTLNCLLTLYLWLSCGGSLDTDTAMVHLFLYLHEFRPRYKLPQENDLVTNALEPLETPNKTPRKGTDAQQCNPHTSRIEVHALRLHTL